MDETKNPESLIDVVFRIAKGVPDSEWARLPADLSKNLDHYLYRTKKPAE
jgi:hypothetical protein